MTDQGDDFHATGYHPLTRWLHTGLVLGVLFQLLCAMLMTHPEHRDAEHGAIGISQAAEATKTATEGAGHSDGSTGELFMAAHRSGGAVISFIVLLNLIWAILNRGNPPARQIAVLFSAKYWHEAWSIAVKTPSLISGKGVLPKQGNAFSRVFEMVGLLLMSLMAITGTIIFSLWAGPGATVSHSAETMMAIHASVAIVLIIYLAGHILMALLYMRAGVPVFARIIPFGSKEKISKGELL